MEICNGQRATSRREGRWGARSTRPWLAAALLALITVLPYWQIRHHDFIGFDDAVYITENDWVRKGVTRQGIFWALTTSHGANWHPLTWLSHMVDTQMFGMSPGAHHLGNLFLHLINTWLLFWVLRRLTGNSWRSAMVAALFAVHPLNVESVAWAAELKTLLSACFGFLSLGAYTIYARQRLPGAYLAALALLCLSLMAKPMLVTLPFVFLLLDYWPLGRMPNAPTDGSVRDHIRSYRQLIIEKIPFLIVVGISCAVTLYAQGIGGAIQPLSHISWQSRLSNALVSYVVYLYKAVWPFGLSVFYPITGSGRSLVPVFGAAALIGGLFIAAIVFAKRKPYLPVGLFWYFGTLVPMIGIVHVGEQAYADRYVYFPLIGIFIVAVWGFQELVRDRRIAKPAACAAALAVLAFLSVRTGQQTAVWRSGERLFAHAIQHTAGNYLAHNNLAVCLSQRGDFHGAVRHLENAIAVSPTFITARANLAVQLLALGRRDAAMEQFRNIVEIDGTHGLAHFHLGLDYQHMGQPDEALRHFSQVILYEPDHAKAYFRIGGILAQKGRHHQARSFFQKASELDPSLPSDGGLRKAASGQKGASER